MPFFTNSFLQRIYAGKNFWLECKLLRSQCGKGYTMELSFLSLYKSVVITEYNVIVKSEELIDTKEYLTL